MTVNISFALDFINIASKIARSLRVRSAYTGTEYIYGYVRDLIPTSTGYGVL